MAETRTGPHGLAFAPTKIGVLIDLDMGTKDDFLACLRFALRRGATRAASSCPPRRAGGEGGDRPAAPGGAEHASTATAGWCEQGVLCTIGPLITDNSIALAPVIDATGVPAVTWTGTDRYFGEYCFNLGNGGLAEEAAIMATWIRRSGYRTVGMIHEISPGGVEYASNFRWYAAREELDVLIEAYTTQIPDDLEAVLRKIRDQGPDCLAYLGYGYPTILMRPMFEKLGWNPPRIMTTAFQFCYAKPEWMAALEGWVGVDQMCEQNPLLGRCSTASRRTSAGVAITPSPRSATTPRGSIAEGLARAPLLTPKRREGGAREGAHAAGGERRTAHAHEPRAVRPQGLQGRLAGAPPHRGRPHGVRRLPRSGAHGPAGRVRTSQRRRATTRETSARLSSTPSAAVPSR